MNNFLAACAAVEEVAATIYRELAPLAENQRLRDVLIRMALDEEDHARQLQFAMRVSPKEAFEGVSDKAGDPCALKVQADQLLARVKSGGQSEYELLKTAVELENGFRSIHAGSALLFKDPSMKKMFEALARADQQHLATLNEYIQEFRKKPPSA